MKNLSNQIITTILLIGMLFPISIFSQNSINITAKKSLSNKSNTPFYEIEHYSLFEIDGKKLHDFSKAQNGSSFLLNLNFGKHHNWEIELQPSKVHGEDYRMLMSSGEEIKVEKNITYKGFLKNDPTIKIRMTISKNAINGIIFDEEMHSFETVLKTETRTKTDLIALYKERESDQHLGCGHVVNQSNKRKDISPKLQNPQQNKMLKSIEDIEIPAFDNSSNAMVTGNTYYPKLGITLDWQGLNEAGSVANFNTDIQTIINIVNGYYDVFDVEYQLSPPHVISSAPNPWPDAVYNPNSFTNNPEEHLTQNFREWAFPNLSPNDYNCALLFTGLNMNGIGYAFYGHMCPGDGYRYGEIDYQYNQTITQRANITTHELGHLWNVLHGGSSSSHIMSPNIWDGNLQWTSTSSNVISTSVNSTFNSCLPTCSSGGSCSPFVDNDNDGYCSDVDCDDNDASVFPGATEICDGIDNDCNGQIDENACNGTYCTPIHTGGQNEIITNVSIGTINNSSGGWNTNITGYSDYTNISSQVDIGINYSITVTSNLSWVDSKLGIWADWNQNYIFDNGEQIASFSGVGPWTTSFTPPVNTTLGATRLRIRLQFGADYTPDPCEGTWYYSGETEDYTLVVTGCTNSTFYADADGDGFGDLNNAISDCSAPSGYVSNNSDCDDNDAAINPNAVEVCDGLDNNCNGQVDENVCGGGTYCTPIHYMTEHELITNVTLGSINNSTGGWNTNITGYSDYTNLSAQVDIGNSYSITVTPNFSFTDSKVGIWADWNQDFVFQSNETIASFSGYGPWTAVVTPPAGAILGTTRLRIRLQYGPNYSPDPCAGAYNSGETEDYSLNVGNGNCSTTIINDYDFESGWGIWNDGGSDARKSINDAAFANTGNYCVRLRDNTSTSVMTTDNLNLSSYSEITVDFSYQVESFENTEDFWLQISTNGGATFTTIEDWIRTIDFQNGERHNPSVTINGPFSATTQIRFRADASGNGDKIYLDDVVISGCGASASNLIVNEDDVNIETPDSAELELSKETETTEMDILETKPERAISEIQLFPNPATDNLNVILEMQSNETIELAIFNQQGQKLQSQHFQTFDGVNRFSMTISELPRRIYLLNVVTSDGSFGKRFVVER